jgi:Transposase domain (DUF772)
MQHADQVLADKEIVAAVYEALAKRHPQSRTRGRRGAPAEVVLRLLVLKHMRNWSYVVLEREVRANLVYRDFTRVGGAKSLGSNPSPPNPTYFTLSRRHHPAGFSCSRETEGPILGVAENLHFAPESS